MFRSLGLNVKILSNNYSRVVSVHKNGLTTSLSFISSSRSFSTEPAVENQVPERDADIAKKVEAALNKEEKNTHIDQWGRTYATGRRKTSVARVWLKPGTGQCLVNGKSFVEYFQPNQRIFALEAFNVTGTSCLYDVMCTVKGGGISGQAGAVRLGVSRALEKFQSELRPSLRHGGYLTRDPRMVERKKSGQKKARKQYQWVKR